MRRTLHSAIIGVLFLCVFEMPAHAATITVINTNDSGPGSLRQALVDANDGDTIAFAVTGTIVLTSGGFVVDKEVTISGPGNVIEAHKHAAELKKSYNCSARGVSRFWAEMNLPRIRFIGYAARKIRRLNP